MQKLKTSLLRRLSWLVYWARRFFATLCHLSSLFGNLKSLIDMTLSITGSFIIRRVREVT
jgi:hypothetical protein